MKFTRAQILSLKTNSTVTDIAIQVPNAAAADLIQAYQDGAQEFSLNPTADALAALPISEETKPNEEEKKPKRSAK